MMARTIERTVAVLLAIVLAAAGLCLQPETHVYADGEKSAFTMGTDVLKDTCNTADAGLVHFAGLTSYVVGYDGEGAAGEDGRLTLLNYDCTGSGCFSGNNSSEYYGSDIKQYFGDLETNTVNAREDQIIPYFEVIETEWDGLWRHRT